MHTPVTRQDQRFHHHAPALPVLSWEWADLEKTAASLNSSRAPEIYDFCRILLRSARPV
jgi:hypothetical protein